MSIVLRGYTSSDNYSLLHSTELQIELRDPKENRIDFIIDVADRDFQDFNGQVADTINFLNKNISQLIILKNKLPELTWELDFGYMPKVTTGELAIESLRFPAELQKFCSDLQIEVVVSLYDGNLFE